MENPFFKKATVFNFIDIIDYQPHSKLFKSILRKTSGYITAVSFDIGEELIGKISPFDTLIQIIDGNAEIIIDGISNLLESGQSIIIPAHSSNIIKAPKRFKMISIIIKHGYEDINFDPFPLSGPF